MCFFEHVDTRRCVAVPVTPMTCNLHSKLPAEKWGLTSFCRCSAQPIYHDNNYNMI